VLLLLLLLMLLLLLSREHSVRDGRAVLFLTTAVSSRQEKTMADCRRALHSFIAHRKLLRWP
jgi:hypothetical protein